MRDVQAHFAGRLRAQWEHLPPYRWWQLHVVSRIDHEDVIHRVFEEGGWSPRYAFMVMMSAGIAVLGLLLSSPAVVIGAMLISPLMNPILGLGFSLALFDFAEMRRAVFALMIGAGAAVLFTALVVIASPLKAPTAEILSRTRPNLFDLLVALFAALAGSFAVIRGKGDTIVGVAIATALMPPLAVVGYGLATWNMPILAGSFALFVTNFVTIALAATVMARFYGFGHRLSSHQSWTQTILLLLVFIMMAVPLGLSLSRIAWEAVTATEVRSLLVDQFGAQSRVTQLDIDFQRTPIAVRAIVIAPRAKAASTPIVRERLASALGTPLTLQLDEVLLEPNADILARKQAELSAQRKAAEQKADDDGADQVGQLVAAVAGVPADAVTIDRSHHRVVASAARLQGASLASYKALEDRMRAQMPEWRIVLVPPLLPLPAIGFASGSDTLDADAQASIALAAWAVHRWNGPTLSIPGLRAVPPKRPLLNQRRGAAIADALRDLDVAVLPAAGGGQVVRLAIAAPAA